jgi:hypothetical protein
MTLPANHQQLVAAATQRSEQYEAQLEKQSRTDDGFVFAKIGEYVPSEAVEEQLRRLAEIQKAANETVFDSRIRF